VEPFPDEVDVPYGLVHTRLICGLPAWVFALLMALGLAPLYLWGWRKWWVTALAFGLGWALAEPARDDPEFVTSWSGELRLKDYYE
jgi:hypothetical protein